MITVVDYGAGNLRSVENTLKFLNVPHCVTASPRDVAEATSILLPGVGHFGQMVRSLEQMEMMPVLREKICSGVPYLGICLGMHALFEGSDEAPDCKGLSIFPGIVRRFPERMPAGLKVPHMGWNQIRLAASSRLFSSLAAGPFVYFAHSYYLPRAIACDQPAMGQPLAAALADYGGEFVAAIESANIFGTQFHPEKSGNLGLKVVASFAAICGEASAEQGGGDAR
jgi:imidazole glycerol phosphate synthase glutamine amidotransferase subunit